MRQVILTRSAQDSAQTARALDASRFEPVIAPLFDICPQHHSVPDRSFDAVIATSRHALCALDPALREKLCQIPLYVVGPATAQSAQEMGFEHIHCGPGNAEGLARLIRAQTGKGCLLFLTGEPRKPDLERALAPHFDLIVCSLYHSVNRTGFPPDALQAITDPEPIWLHFSEKSAERAAKFIKNTGYEAFFTKGLHIAIAPAITEMLNATGCQHCLTAAQPTQKALLETLHALPYPSP